jgi:hypothetical protein
MAKPLLPFFPDNPFMGDLKSNRLLAVVRRLTNNE